MLTLRSTRLAMPLAVLALCSIAAIGFWPSAAEEKHLDLSNYEVSFAEEFDTLDVSAWGPKTRWIAHTPWNGDFGDAQFVDPRPGFPFTVDNGMLTITAARNENGKWEAGLLSGHDLKGNGFAQTYGYFEMRAKLPPGEGVWPAFWLMGTERDKYAVEVDVIEFYGHDPKKFQSYYHIWQRDGQYPEKHVGHMQQGDIDLTDDFHTFGVMIEKDKTTFYLDGRSYWSFDTPEEFAQPLFPLVNLALGSGFSIENTPDPSRLLVDYIRIYKKKEG